MDFYCLKVRIVADIQGNKTVVVCLQDDKSGESGQVKGCKLIVRASETPVKDYPAGQASEGHCHRTPDGGAKYWH